MAEVTINYKDAAIATMDVSGTKTLQTQGKYCEDDISVEYVKPAGPSGTKQISITANGTTTEDVTNYASAEITVNVQGGGGAEPLYELGSYYHTTEICVTRHKNHIKIEHIYGSPPATSIGLREFSGQLNLPEWFSIPAGSVVELRYENVVNTNGVVWNANFKQANSNTSLSYGIENGTHENGATVTVTPTKDQSIGCLFVYVDRLRSGQSLEFDVIVTIDGVRYI